MSAIWQPQWQANTAYLTDAFTIPTASVFAGYTWYCITPGTSAGTEPTWPDPTITPTVTDGTVTWQASSATRQMFQYGVTTLMKTFSAANPTIVRSVRTVRPPSFAGSTSLPVFYLGDLSEVDNYAPGVGNRSFPSATGYLVDQMGTIEDSNDRMNFVADALWDYFTRNYHAFGARGIFGLSGIIDYEETEGTVRYPALEFQFGNSSQAEGRT